MNDIAFFKKLVAYILCYVHYDIKRRKYYQEEKKCYSQTSRAAALYPYKYYMDWNIAGRILTMPTREYACGTDFQLASLIKFPYDL